MPILFNGKELVGPSIDKVLVDTINTHISSKSNPHDITYSQIGAADTLHTHTLAALGAASITHSHTLTDLTTAAPKPTTDSGIGQWININQLGGNYYLPSGGTWIVLSMLVNNGAGTIGSIYNSGVYSGGSALYTSIPSSQYVSGFAWRIS